MYAEAEHPDVVFGVGDSARRLTAQDAEGTNASVVEQFKVANVAPRLPADYAIAFDTALNSDAQQLAVSIRVEDATLSASFSPQVLTRAAAECVLHQLADVAHHIATQPDAKFLDNALAIRAELQAALNAHPTRVDVNEGELLHSAFERNARESPDKLALWFKFDDAREDVKWTYAELNHKAAVLARAIKDAAGEEGVVDCAVPLCMDKTPELYVAILGALKVRDNVLL